MIGPTVLGLSLLLSMPRLAAAQLRLTPLISDGVVLQRDAAVPVWGWADHRDTIAITFDRQTYTAIPDTGGRWIVKLSPRAAGGPFEMTVLGRHQQLQVRNILVGDVWLCSGQSNMALPVIAARNAAQEIAAARDGRIRHFRVSRGSKTEPVAELKRGAWEVADSAHVGGFTAVGYFFARELRKSVDVPIGLIHAAVDGSDIPRWMSREALHLDAAAVAMLETGKGGNDPSNFVGATQFYNTMIYPLLSYPIKGILWYQGQNEAGYSGPSGSAGADIPIKYRELFTGLIQSWRDAWGLGDLPFLFVQLENASYGPVDTVPPRSSSWALLRESQSAALRLPNTAQVVAIDLGEGHSPDKQEVGARLALVARNMVYGEKVNAAGPRYRRQTVSGGRVVLEFDEVGRGLVLGPQGSELQGFAIAGVDRQFVWATAKLERDRVVVWSERVPKPVAVRYAWSNKADRANLYNRAGLPATPFRTDEWP